MHSLAVWSYIFLFFFFFWIFLFFFLFVLFNIEYPMIRLIHYTPRLIMIHTDIHTNGTHVFGNLLDIFLERKRCRSRAFLRSVAVSWSIDLFSLIYLFSFFHFVLLFFSIFFLSLSLFLSVFFLFIFLEIVRSLEIDVVARWHRSVTWLMKYIIL